MKIRFVYFDLGNVLTCFCHERLLRQVADVVGRSVDEIMLAYFEADGLQQRYERSGKVFKQRNGILLSLCDLDFFDLLSFAIFIIGSTG